ncbi:MAG: HEAT repeat domain-containing protein [Oscillatoriales cyanobacterium]|nr:MAG: HEAT repeat domain-containing protein [Oscillatoriales cyanobacterium]
MSASELPEPSVDSANQPRQLTPAIAIADLQQTEDTSKRYYAAWWIGNQGVTDEAARKALIEALADETDRSPDGGYPLRRNAAKALGKVGHTEAVEPLIGCLACEDYYVRESAAQALEALGDQRAIAPLVALLDGGVAAAIAVPGKPHLVQPYDAILEALGALGATAAIVAVEPFCHHETARISYSAHRAMYQLTGEDRYAEVLVQALQGRELQLRRSALMDIGVIGYYPAARPVAETLAENSLKLISLKGILERTIQDSWDQQADQVLTQETIATLQLMDDLL